MPINPDNNENMNSVVNTTRRPWARALTYNSSEDDYPAVLPTLTKPVSVDVSGKTANLAIIPCLHTFTQMAFFGADTANDDFACKIYYWSSVDRITPTGDTHAVPLWVPQLVCELDVTLSAKIGVATTPLVAADKIADTITEIGTSDTSALVRRWSPADDATAAYVLLDTLGAELIQVSFDLSGGSGTAGTEGNLIYRQY